VAIVESHYVEKEIPHQQIIPSVFIPICR